MASGTNIEDLSKQIADLSSTVQKYLSSKKLPNLSLSQDGPLDFPADAPDEIQAARHKLREVSKLMLDLATGPTEAMKWFSGQAHDFSTLQYIYRFRLAEAVPLHETISFVDLAKKAGVDEAQCRRIVRYAITNGLFEEPREGYVAHTGKSVLLRDPFMRDMIGYTTESSFPAATKQVAAIEKYGASEETNQTAWTLSTNTDLTFFEYMSKDKELARRFTGLMVFCADSFPSPNACIDFYLI